jgi:hypothetical protein
MTSLKFISYTGIYFLEEYEPLVAASSGMARHEPVQPDPDEIADMGELVQGHGGNLGVARA